ncbi:MAG: SRPBCC family protein [Dysgonamonadaceae bacterium]|nr:SRPBCC family protein [Dysgonamonadaceae bacterium]
MTEFTSDVKQIPHHRQLVYDTLSNMENLAKVKNHIPEDKLRDLSFDRDSCSFSVQSLGELRMVIVNRENPQTVQWALEKAPVDAQLQIELLPENENETQIRLMVSADLNPFIRPMVSKPLQEGINKIADLLAAIPYNELQE